MAKFEEVLPALRAGKRGKVHSFPLCTHKITIENDEMFSTNLLGNKRKIEALEIELLLDDWEIVEEPKKKVKYYPLLLKQPSDGKILISNNKYRNVEEALSKFSTVEIIRLVTEVPELIEEREE